MAEQSTILVTGVGGYWGAKVAARLLENSDGRRVIGLDAEKPKEDLKGLDFIQADIRNPLLVELLQVEEVDVVCHLAFMETMRPSEAAFDFNLLGTMKVLGACAEAGVKKVILRSSTKVYGANPTNTAFLAEAHPLQGSRKYGSTRDMVEIEAFCNGFRRQAPEITLSVLRFPSLIGPEIDSPMTRFLADPWAPVLLGFDPRMQLIHESDAIEALVHCVGKDLPGVFNVAADQVLPLSRITGLAGKLPLPIFHLAAYWGLDALGSIKRSVYKHWPIELDYLRYPWVGDLEKMRTEMNFVPRYTAEEALREFAGQQRVRRYMPESVSLAFDEERLRDTIERRRRAKSANDSRDPTEQAVEED
jgi:UDP-glucose 4-epimerase